jgi:hypothetical protein
MTSRRDCAFDVALQHVRTEDTLARDLRAVQAVKKRECRVGAPRQRRGLAERG